MLARRSGGDHQGGVLFYLVSGFAGLNGLAGQDPSLHAAATGAADPYPFPLPYRGDHLGSGMGSWTFQGLVGLGRRFGLPLDPTISMLSYVRVGPSADAVSN